MLVRGFRWEVGDGSRVSFWRDIWVVDTSLRDLCPRCFQLAGDKEGLVKEMGNRQGDVWHWQIKWRRGRRGLEESEEQMLKEVLDNVQIKEGVPDRWKWKYNVDGTYQVKKAYDFLANVESLMEVQLCKFTWCRLVPSKVGFFGWRLLLDRLPTKRNLQKRGVALQGDGLRCVLCNEEVEEINHLFCNCLEAWLVWVRVFNWWGLDVVWPNTVQGVAELFMYSMGRLVGKEVSATMFLVVGWYLWYWRNTRVFGRGGELKEKLVDMIQVKSFFWVKLKVPDCAFLFSQWQLNPAECTIEIKRQKKCLKLFR
ncbi:hypothetical protein SLA2020_086230 [Shorea laevis]